MTELLKCGVCGLLNPTGPSASESCEGCASSLAGAELVSAETTGDESDPATQAPDHHAADPEDSAEYCKCLFLALAGHICRNCGLPGTGTGASGPSPIGETAEPRDGATYRALYGGEGSVAIDRGLLIGRGYMGVPPDFAEWLSSRMGVSRRHCLLQAGPRGFTVVDLGSTNGTTVGGIPIPAGVNHSVSADRFPLTIGLGHHASLRIERIEGVA